MDVEEWKKPQISYCDLLIPTYSYVSLLCDEPCINTVTHTAIFTHSHLASQHTLHIHNTVLVLRIHETDDTSSEMKI